MSPVAAWTALLASTAGVFSAPSAALFADLAAGWVLCPGRRTITRVLRAGDPPARRAHDAYHRFVRAGAWSMTALWRVLAIGLVDRFAATGPIRLDLDDTLYVKTGRRIEGIGLFRDPVRSTAGRMVKAFGLNLVVLTLRVDPPWGGEPLALPVNVRLHRKGGPTHIEHGAAMLRELADWLPQRHFRLHADGAYASLVAADLPRTHVTSRIRRNAALYGPVPPRTGRPGRPRTKGPRLPNPADLAAERHGFTRARLNLRGHHSTRALLSRQVIWYEAHPTRLLHLVIITDPAGVRPDEYLISTDLDTPPAALVEDYAGRWAIEDTFRNTKQFLGGEDPQSWKHAGPERAAALSLWLSSAVWAWYIPTDPTSRRWPDRPWYPAKRTPSFADALAALRRTLWQHRITQTTPNGPLPPEITDALVESLAYAA